MKRLISTLALLGLLSLGASAQYRFVQFAQLVNGSGQTIVTLEYGVKSSGYDGAVKWRISNRSNQTLYKPSLGDQTYTLKNGQRVNRSGRSFSNRLSPGESYTTQAIYVNSDQNYGTWSDQNDNPVTYYAVSGPMVKFTLDPKEYFTKAWDDFGRVQIQ